MAAVWKNKRPGLWEVVVGQRVGKVWEVASRPGQYQWSVHHATTFVSLGSGDGDGLLPSVEEAQRTVNQFLGV